MIMLDKEVAMDAKTLIAFGALGMVASLLIASRISSGWVITWLVSAAALAFGIGIRGER